jgi:hypothetical protein
MRGLSVWKKSPLTASVTKESNRLLLTFNLNLVCFISTAAIQGRNAALWLSCITSLSCTNYVVGDSCSSTKYLVFHTSYQYNFNKAITLINI